MSGASPSPGVSSTAPPGGAFHRVREFWERISEGRQLDDLWSQFAADARAGYGFYGKDVDWDAIQKLPRWRRPFYVAKDIFWATLMKMTPARRVLLLLALAMLLMSGFTFQFGHDVGIQFKFESFAALIFLLLLSLELADKVAMKRDLEIAREIQSWLVPSQAPEVAGADIAFATRPQNSVAGEDRKSTRLNSSHVEISYAVFCLKKKKKQIRKTIKLSAKHTILTHRYNA